ncbi:MAG: hypothetical protein RLO81_05165 [Fulvivirga sp.]|uniref:hypothetical protein n=1 Tax=Fulvivirga sp. TaxID=1931237 RepID=UPI0032EDB647
MNSYQVLHYHFTLPPKKISFLEVSKVGSLIGVNELSTYDKETLTSRLALLFKFLKKKNYVLVYFSSSFLDMLEKEFPSNLDTIKGHVKSGEIVLVASCAYHSLSFLCHPALFNKEVEFHKNVYKKHFNKQADWFINTAGLFNDQLINHLNQHNFKGLLAPANSWHLNEIKTADYYQSAGEKPIKILLSNGDSSKGIYACLANGFGSGYNDQDLQSSNLQELKKYLSSKTKKDIYSASMPLSSPEWSNPMAQYLSSPLQKAIFEESRRLIDKAHQKLTDEDWMVIMLICQPEMLFKLSSNHQNAFQHFINCMNVLTAIGLKYK